MLGLGCRLIDSEAHQQTDQQTTPELNLARRDIARLVGDEAAWLRTAVLPREGGGVETPPTVRNGKDKKSTGGESGPKRPQG